VAGFAFGNGIHGQSAGIAGGEFERGGIEIHRCKSARKTPSRHEGKRQAVPTAPKSAGDCGGSIQLLGVLLCAGPHGLDFGIDLIHAGGFCAREDRFCLNGIKRQR
jgi:hypothetical protein